MQSNLLFIFLTDTSQTYIYKRELRKCDMISNDGTFYKPFNHIECATFSKISKDNWTKNV